MKKFICQSKIEINDKCDIQCNHCKEYFGALQNQILILYHGSPIKIKDTGMASGTYFTDDFDVAKQYGEIVYRFITNDNTIGLFEKDCFNEHWISKRLIPFRMFEII